MIGFLLFLLGFVIRFISIRQLKNCISWRIFTPKEMITSGIYTHIRHPMYLGGLIMGFGLFLFFTHWTIAICLSYLQFQWYLDRIDREEQLMVNAFGATYWEYMKKTKRFIPFIF